MPVDKKTINIFLLSKFNAWSKALSMLWVTALVIAAPVNAQMQEVPLTDGMLYYRIGGGRHITIPPSLTITTINLSASASMAALNCGRFDIGESIEASLNDLSNGVDNAINAIETSASAAIATLPGYILQKANPGLYDLFQNALLRAQESFSLATKSCERMEYEISQNINPYAEWITLSRGDSWKRSIGIGERNIHHAVDEAEAGHNEGLTWLGGITRGGDNQEPIRVLGDVASAGLNILSGRPPESSNNLPNNASLTQHFAGPDEVKSWIWQVLGDIEISVCDSCQRGSIPGRGLIPYIEQQTDTIASALTALVTDQNTPNRQNLAGVSAPGIAITHQVIEAIRNQSSAERSMVVQKLSQEIAEARTMEEAMIIRRLLLTGKKDGDVSAVKMAVTEVDKALTELDKEINNVIFEKRVRGELVTNTVIEVLLQDNAKRQRAMSMPAVMSVDEHKLEGGAVSP